MIVSRFVKAGICPFLSAYKVDTICKQTDSNEDMMYIEMDRDSEEFESDQSNGCF